MLANSSLYLIWQHLVCNPDLYCGLLSFLANDITVFISVLSTIVILLILYGADFTSVISYSSHSSNYCNSVFSNNFKAQEVSG